MKNIYKILDDVFDGSGLTVQPSNSTEILNLVYSENDSALKVNLIGGGSGTIVVDDIAARDQLLTDGEVEEGQIVYVKSEKVNYVLTGSTNSDWEEIGGGLWVEIDPQTYRLTNDDTSITLNEDYIKMIVNDNDSLEYIEEAGNLSYGTFDDETNRLSYLNVNINSGITLKTDTVGVENFSTISLDSDYIYLDNTTESKVVLRSPNGTQYILSVDNSGNIITTSL